MVCCGKADDVADDVVSLTSQNKADQLREFGHQMRLSYLPACLSLNCFLDAILAFESSFKSYTFSFPMLFCSIFFAQKFNSCATDRRTDGPTDGRTHSLKEMQERI